MKYPKEVIDSALNKLARNISVEEIHIATNIPKSTIYSWKKKYKDRIEKIAFLIPIIKDNEQALKNKDYEKIEQRAKEYPDVEPIQNHFLRALPDLIKTVNKGKRKYYRTLAKNISLTFKNCSIQKNYVHFLFTYYIVYSHDYSFLDRIFEICEQYSENADIQVQYLQILSFLSFQEDLKAKRNDYILKAKEISERLPLNNTIQTCYIALMMDLNNKINKDGTYLYQALLSSRRCLDCESIRMQHVRILGLLTRKKNISSFDKKMYREELDDVVKKYPQDLNIVLFYAHLLGRFKEYEKAQEIIKKYPQDIRSLEIHVEILISYYQDTKNISYLEDAIAFCTEHPSRRLSKVQKQAQDLLSFAKGKKVEETNHNETLRSLLNQLRNQETIDLEKVSLSFFQKKMLLLIEAYEKNMPIQMILKEVKELQIKYQDNPLILKTLQTFLSKIKGKKTIFDVDKYYFLLNQDFHEKKSL